MLMIKVLSNNDIISYLYDRIFHKNKMNQQTAQLERTEDGKRLPRLSFNISYQNQKG
jgi:hypothetical protein